MGFGKPRSRPARTYTVRLHFAEPDDAKPGDRVFDVKIQGKVMLKGFDVVQAAGGPRRAVVREFTGIRAGDELTVELVPPSLSVRADAAPILSGLEVSEQAK